MAWPGCILVTGTWNIHSVKSDYSRSRDFIRREPNKTEANKNIWLSNLFCSQKRGLRTINEPQVRLVSRNMVGRRSGVAAGGYYSEFYVLFTSALVGFYWMDISCAGYEYASRACCGRGPRIMIESDVSPNIFGGLLQGVLLISSLHRCVKVKCHNMYIVSPLPLSVRVVCDNVVVCQCVVARCVLFGVSVWNDRARVADGLFIAAGVGYSPGRREPLDCAVLSWRIVS